MEAAAEELSAALLDVVEPGTWAVYGAYKLVDDIADAVCPPSKERLTLLGLEFLRSRGVPWNTGLAPVQKDFWTARNPGGAREWIPWPDPPGPGAGPADLPAGEERHVATIRRGDGGVNQLHLRRAGDGFEAVLRSEGPEFVWYTEPTLYELYLRVGGALCTQPEWASADLDAYIPQPAVDLT